LLDKETLRKYDSRGMYEKYDRWPEIAQDAYESNLEPVDFADIDHVVFSGMGGSGTISDLFQSVLSKTKIHVTVVKGYLLPKTVDEKTLIVATSVSGDTAETLTIAQSANKQNCKLVGFSSGGKLESFCNNNDIPFRKIPYHLNPRTSFPSFAFSMIKTLNSILSISKHDVKESLQKMNELQSKINSNEINEANPSYSLAKQMHGIPLIYYPWGLHAAAIRFKNSIQENMKSHAMIEDVIEASHNGIVSWENKSKVIPIIIRGKDDYIKTKERWDVIKEFFNSRQIEFLEIDSVDGSILSKIVNLIYHLDYTTIYGAVLQEIDPSPVKSIDFVKERI